ncbi:MAG: hypothetical protein IJT58_02125 [Synergistaceae bacterium]|nr:hypothetical protein [Synergistaceae bacterium]
MSGLLNDDELRRLQIRETIRSHLLGIKVLSLFFIDEVAHYRKYKDDDDDDGEPSNGMFAKRTSHEVQGEASESR